MTRSTLLDEMARQLLESESSNRGANTSTRSRSDAAVLDPETHCLSWMLPELLDLVAQHPSRPVDAITPEIRRRVAELYFLDDCGDCVLTSRDTAVIDGQVDLLVWVLEQVRKIAVAQGLWSGSCPAPQMFG